MWWEVGQSGKYSRAACSGCHIPQWGQVSRSGMGFKTRLYSFCYILRYSECVKELIIEEGSFESKNVTIFKFNI